MFDILLSIKKLLLTSFFSFLIIFAFRQLCIERIVFIFLFHACLFCLLFLLCIGGAQVEKEGYLRLNEFITLEAEGQLEIARNNLETYDSMLQIDLQAFDNSDQYEDYLIKHSASVDNSEAITLGWFIVLLSEIWMGCLSLYKKQVTRRRLLCAHK